MQNLIRFGRNAPSAIIVTGSRRNKPFGLCTGSLEDSNTAEDAGRNLRVVSAVDYFPLQQPGLQVMVTKTLSKKKMELQVIELRDAALELGQVCLSIDRFARNLGTGLARRLAQRSGNFIYQTVAFSSDNFPLEAADQLLPPGMVTRNDVRAKTWKATTMAEVREVFSPLLSAQSMYICAGLSRALRTASEKVVRVIATPMPSVEISWVDVDGIDKLYVNFQYVLWDEHGELNPPKSPDRADIELEEELQTDLRQQVMLDLMQMYNQGVPLSPGFLRQMGHTEEAMALEAILLNQPQPEEAEDPQISEVEGEASTASLT